MLIAADTETTNLDTINGEIIQLSMMVVDESTWKVLSEILLFIRPERPQYIHPKALETNGFKIEAFDKPPFISKKEAVEILLKWVAQFPPSINASKLPLLGCNISYDEAMLRTLFNDTGMEWPFGYRKLDITTLSYAISQLELGVVDASSGGLAAAAKKYDIQFGHHDARQDVLATIEVYHQQIEYLKSLKWLNKAQEIQESIRLT